MEEFFSNKGWAKSIGSVLFLVGFLRIIFLWFLKAGIPIWHDAAYIVLGAGMYLSSKTTQAKTANIAIGALLIVVGAMAIMNIVFTQVSWSFKIFNIIAGAATIFIGFTKN